MRRVARSLLAVQAVHGAFRTLLEKHWQRAQRLIDGGEDLVLFFPGRAPQDVIDHLRPVAGMPDAEGAGLASGLRVPADLRRTAT